MSDFNACCINLTEKGFSPKAAARACAIAEYKKQAGTVKDTNKEAMKIASSFSGDLESQPIQTLSIEEDAFEFQVELGESPFPDPFKPFLDPERGYSDRMLREILLVRKGRFNGIEITDDHLTGFAESFSLPIPFMVDHKTDYGSKVGELLSVRKANGKLYGLAEFVGYGVVSDIVSGKARYVSIGFNLNPDKLREVSLTHFPAVGGNDPARIINPKISPNKSNFCQHKAPSGSEAGDTITQDQKGSGKMSAAKTDPEGKVQDDGILNEFRAKVSQMEAESQSNKQKLQEQEAIIKEFREKMAKQEAQIRMKEITGAILEFCQKGLSVPANSELELEFMSSLNDEQIAKYKEIKEKTGPVIALSRVDLTQTKVLSETESAEKSKANEAFAASLKK